MQSVIILATVGVSAAATTMIAPTNIDPVHQYAWTENAGWTSWRDAGDAAQGVRIGNRFLSGFVWAENVGFINLGNGAPADGVQYANLDGSDAGVNLDPDTGDLFGLGWGENIGWINFDTRAALGPFAQQARFDIQENRLRGFAWAENLGWVNFDDLNYFVATIPPECPNTCGDINGNGGEVNLLDFAAFAICFGKSASASQDCDCSDLNGDGTVNLFDFATFSFLFGSSSTNTAPNCP